VKEPTPAVAKKPVLSAMGPAKEADLGYYEATVIIAKAEAFESRKPAPAVTEKPGLVLEKPYE
jgi:hypothetical protein